jgi:hypothetical protein
VRQCYGELGQCVSLAQSISVAITSALKGEGGSSIVKPLAIFCSHLALLARCHLFSRQATSTAEILYTYSLVAFGLHFRFELKKSELSKRHDLYLMASLINGMIFI